MLGTAEDATGTRISPQASGDSRCQLGDGTGKTLNQVTAVSVRKHEFQFVLSLHFIFPSIAIKIIAFYNKHD